jgi:hypothetical protein
MSHHVEQEIRINAPASKVWEVLGDFASVEHFSTGVDRSPLLPGKTEGVGTKRICYFYDKTSVVEEITRFEDGKSFDVVLTEYSMPLKSLHATMGVRAVSNTTSDIYMSMDYVVKFGPLGWVMGVLLMRPMMNKVMKGVLKGLAFHSSTGKHVATQLPDDHEMAAILV